MLWNASIDVVEAQADSGIPERLVVNHAAVPARAGGEELPRGGRALLRRALQVTADGFGIGKCKIVETDQVAGSGPSAEQSFTECELERGNVPTEEDDRSPSILVRWRDLEEIVHQLCV
jgi:hypothetical protein